MNEREREEIEQRITAALLGQLSPEEMAELEALIAADPELQALREKLRRAADLLREATASMLPGAAIAVSGAPEPPPLRLSVEKRKQLLRHLRGVAPGAEPEVKIAAPELPANDKPVRKLNWGWALQMGVAAAWVGLIGIGVLMMNPFGGMANYRRHEAPGFAASEAPQDFDPPQIPQSFAETTKMSVPAGVANDTRGVRPRDVGAKDSHGESLRNRAGSASTGKLADSATKIVTGSTAANGGALNLNWKSEPGMFRTFPGTPPPAASEPPSAGPLVASNPKSADDAAAPALRGGIYLPDPAKPAAPVSGPALASAGPETYGLYPPGGVPPAATTSNESRAKGLKPSTSQLYSTVDELTFGSSAVAMNKETPKGASLEGIPDPSSTRPEEELRRQVEAKGDREIAGRTAFWNEDESAKRNVPTSEAAPAMGGALNLGEATILAKTRDGGQSARNVDAPRGPTEFDRSPTAPGQTGPVYSEFAGEGKDQLAKSGAGTLTLQNGLTVAGTNSYTGQTTLNAGTLGVQGGDGSQPGEANLRYRYADVNGPQNAREQSSARETDKKKSETVATTAGGMLLDSLGESSGGNGGFGGGSSGGGGGGGGRAPSTMDRFGGSIADSNGSNLGRIDASALAERGESHSMAAPKPADEGELSASLEKLAANQQELKKSVAALSEMDFEPGDAKREPALSESKPGEAAAVDGLNGLAMSRQSAPPPPADNSLFADGGTSGRTPTVDASWFPLKPGGQSARAKTNTGREGTGNSAPSQNAIDALMFGLEGESARKPALGSFSGVFTDPQFQTVVPSLDQKEKDGPGGEVAPPPADGEKYASVDDLRVTKMAADHELPAIERASTRHADTGDSFANDEEGHKQAAQPIDAPQRESTRRSEQPDTFYYNKTITPKFRQDVAHVKQWMDDAKGFLDSGRYDFAYKRAEQILNIDPYNIAARKLEEEINKKKSDYALEGYNQTRSYSQPELKQAEESGIEAGLTDPAATLQWKLDQIVVPKVDLRDATLRETLDFLKQKSVQLDADSHRGVNFKLHVEPSDSSDPKPPAVDPDETRITMSLRNVPLREVYRRVAEAAGLAIKVTPQAVVLEPKGQTPGDSETKSQADPSQQFLDGYTKYQEAEKLTAQNEFAAGREKYQEALRDFDQIITQFPDWNLSIVRFRREMVTKQLAKLNAAETQAKALAEQKAKEAAEQAKPEPPQPKVAPDPLIPQPEVPTSANAFSTFSLNVTDVAFKLTAASLERGTLPEVGNMRSEEFINAFDYGDPEALPGNAMAFTTERARYPFAQNRDILRFSIKTAAAGRAQNQPLNLVLLLDNSGSMERADRVRIVKEAMRVLTAQFHEGDKLSLITFSRTPRLWADGVVGKEAAAQATARATEITPQGGTDLEAALDLGYQTAAKHFVPNGSNRVVLLTDGAANLGNVDPAALQKKVEAHRLQGIALDSFGVGWEGYNDDLLEQLTRHGDGRYGFINSPEEASTGFAAQLAGALRVAAADVKVQVEFNPKRVTSYRQIGYAKHQLTKEQFRDNTVDAAELGAAEAGNALYTVEVNPSGSGDLATVHVRYKVPGTTEYREQAWPVPFTGHALPLEQASPALRLATTASAFSEMLANSPYASEVTSDRLLSLLNGVPDKYAADPRPKKLEWMIRTAKSLSGR